MREVLTVENLTQLLGSDQLKGKDPWCRTEVCTGTLGGTGGSRPN